LSISQLDSSSEAKGWKDLSVHARLEPMEYDGLIGSALPDIALVQLTQGSLRIEQRCSQGFWQAFDARPGDLFLNPPANGTREIRWRSFSSEAPRLLYVRLSAELLARTAAEVAAHNPAQVTLVGRSGFQDPVLMSLGMALQSELDGPSTAGSLYAQTAAQMLAVHLLRHYATTDITLNEPAQSLTPRQLRQVTDFILSSLGQDLPLQALAQEVGFSSYHFARLFRRATGESPHQYVLRQRIERAQRLLREADLPLAQIALDCGFANQSHLTLAFKRLIGVTPAAYRRQRTGRARFYKHAHD
jgi:AraC family transcriptional regulator